ncbi:MAG: CDP-alcohol phosphatidyltransferase family protein [Treponema sp.]|nr:CDP-alcohol phosphatidyltransferase family protein [Treponema sp.]
MNAATIVTSLRIALSPVFFILFTSTVKDGHASPIALCAIWLLFGIIEITDFVDGRIARKTDSVTPFGKVFDPFADSVARLTYFLSYLVTGLMPGWVFLIILYRDLGLSFIRLMFMSRGTALGARLSGKVKAWVYAVAGGAALAFVTLRSIETLGSGWAASAASIFAVAVSAGWGLCILAAAWSLIDYIAAFSRHSALR